MSDFTEYKSMGRLFLIFPILVLDKQRIIHSLHGIPCLHSLLIQHILLCM